MTEHILNRIFTSASYYFSANAEIENAKKSGDAEVTVLRAQLKKAEMKISSMEKDIEQKVFVFLSIQKYTYVCTQCF